VEDDIFLKKHIAQFLQENSDCGFLSFNIEQQAKKQFKLSYKEIEIIALKLNITPLRYKKNQTTISIKNQLKLLNSDVSIIGCGGLGGHISEILTRIGIGNITIFDHDIFEEHNLNRQNFSNYNSLGREKVLVIKEELKLINPSVNVKAIVKKFNPFEDMNLIKNTNIVIDALDNPQTKLDLSFICKKKNITFIHGAIAGMNGQFTSNTLEKLYKNGDTGIENSIGNPSFSVTFAASIQCSETIKILLNKGEILNNNILITDLLENEFTLL
jgi:molybdopterin/thiamine biosynthesis adenylyltransferase